MSQKIYDQIANQLLSELSQQNRSQGYQLPSEAELCRQYGCSRQTIRKALASLTEKGILSSRQGSGSFLAKPMAMRRSKEIALLLPSVNRFIYPDILNGVESVLAPLGYRVTIYQASTVRVSQAILSRLIEDPPGGVIAQNNEISTPLLDSYQKLRDLGIPLILLENPSITFQDCSVVAMDSYSAAADAAKKMFDAGRRNIHCISPTTNLSHRLRANGFLCGMLRCGLPIEEDSTVYFYFNADPNGLFFENPLPRDTFLFSNDEQILNVLKNADGVLAGDMYIESVLDILKEYDRVPGKDVSVITMTNSRFLDRISMPLSAYSHGKEKMGIAAANMMLRLLNGGRNEQLYLPFEFIDRGSV